jgi:hypothetical protein
VKSALRHQLPALVVAIVALIAALGGTVFAGKLLTKKKAKRIADREITRLAPTLSVAKAKGADSAGVANKVGPLGATSVDFRAPSGTGRSTITTIDGLILEGSCPSGNTLFEVSSATTGAFHSAALPDTGTPISVNDPGLQPGEHRSVNQSAGTEAVGTLHFLTSDGAQVTMSFQTQDDPGGGSTFTDCSISGHAFST